MAQKQEERRQERQGKYLEGLRLYEHEIKRLESKSTNQTYETKMAKQVKMQMMRDNSSEQIVQKQKQQLASRKMQYGQRVIELYKPDTSMKKVQQSQQMLRDEYNPYIKKQTRQLSVRSLVDSKSANHLPPVEHISGQVQM